eukprot:TRINITY_DN7898_c0_g6_i1.p1 TRINITY_DN7898_c0_g6~~TRINITY_DN7898_c0_g6_i1.p1  ORF type:complete len:302 (-),score=32.58 TRINITY_DN7898_c0_g6_i1:12-917(-)
MGVVNFISNSFRFTRKGSITVNLKPGRNESVKIEVVDTGLGIREEDQPKLLKAFGKLEADDYARMNNMGVGLGLMISNSLARMLGGKGVEFTSVYGRGSTFSIEIPTRQNPPQPETFSPETGTPVSFIGGRENLEFKPSTSEVLLSKRKHLEEQCFCTRVLIVDDNDFNLLVLKRKLKSVGEFEVIQADDGSQALELLSKHDLPSCQLRYCSAFRLVITDINMPILSGFDLVKSHREMVARGEAKYIPFVLSSAFYTDKDLQRGSTLGVDEWIQKPITEEKLLSLLRKYNLPLKNPETINT